MPDDVNEDQNTEASGGAADQPHEGSSPSPRPTRRPRPAPTSAYVPGRRTRANQASSINPYVVPVVALVALLALLAALLFDHFHNTTAATAPAATAIVAATQAPQTPSATPQPTATPIILATPITTKAGAAAAVNGEAVPMSMLVDESNAAISQLQVDHQNSTTGATIKGISVLTPAGKAAAKKARQDTLKSLIETYLIVGYGKQHHIVASQKEIDSTLSGYYSQSGGQAAFDTMIKIEGFTVADVKEIATSSATINDVFTAVTKNIACKPCGELHARHILFKAKDKAQAETVAKHLQADKGSDFAAYAKKYSTDTASAKLGGDLGWFDNTTMVAEFTKAAFAMKVGQVSDPVKSTYGYHVIQVLGQRASSAQKNTYFTNWIKSQQKTQVVQTYVKF